MGIGFAILANSRPYEGLVFSLPVVAALIWLIGPEGAALPFCCLSSWSWRDGPGHGLLFCAINGNPFFVPYSLYRNTFTMAPHFIWQAPRPEPVYHHRVLRDYYTGWEMNVYTDARANRPPHDLLGKAQAVLAILPRPISHDFHS